MENYRIVIKKSAAKELESTNKQDKVRIVERIRKLAFDPRPAGSKKLSGQEKYRVRQGNYRILYKIEDNELIITVVQVGHRKDVYKNWCEPLTRLNVANATSSQFHYIQKKEPRFSDCLLLGNKIDAVIGGHCSVIAARLFDKTNGERVSVWAAFARFDRGDNGAGDVHNHQAN